MEVLIQNDRKQLSILWMMTVSCCDLFASDVNFYCTYTALGLSVLLLLLLLLVIGPGYLIVTSPSVSIIMSGLHCILL